ncbi:ExbD/TolR family protein [Snuella sedimenti]|uniref:Biopolymer transporter ExbD n=1 Tax=Snuella sedimenti TaxID=2798802 RepID=A0A8J7LNV8_9FLAO|nr:biopolymer transporter ExbD [Snuella sedimenti]MBJ6369054.1 biopolymer transporter ExbD [Snuella sedimenti]
MAKRAAPEVNAGSMADIAFLLLIFFLVTTTIETDSGINRKLPPIEDNTEPPIIKQRNIFTVLINGKNQLMVEEELTELKDLRQAAIDFLDNNADGSCSYCNGKKEENSSVNPDKAIISLKNERETSYEMYISVQNELVAAYNELRNRLAKSRYGKSFIEMQADYKDVNWPGNKEKLKGQIDQIKLDYPMKLSEVQ